MSAKQISTTKQKILKETGKLFAQRGYFGISMQDIANEVGITKAALYYHFNSKSQLAETLLTDSVNELKSELKIAVERSKNSTDIFFNMIKTFLDYKMKHPEITLLQSLGLNSDKSLPIVRFAISLRIELMKFLEGLIIEIGSIRKMTSRAISVLMMSLMGFVLSPIQNTPRNTKQLAKDFTMLIVSNPATSENKKKSS